MNMTKKTNPVYTQINLRVEEDVKKQAEQVCSEIGISMSSAIIIYLKRIGRERKIPFILTAGTSEDDSVK